MELLSLQTLFFFLLVAIAYYFVPNVKHRPYVLLIASEIYYILYAGILNFVIFCSYVLLISSGIYFLQNPDFKPIKRKIIYWPLIIISSLLFLLWKTFLIIPLDSPPGMSYWILIAIGLLTDVYLGGLGQNISFSMAGLLVGFFPLIMSGPIIRAGDSFNEICEGHTVSYKRVTFGLQRVLWGLFKKLVISERLAVLVSTVYDGWQEHCVLYFLTGTICFCFQLYTDFSGSMDIIYGGVETLGITLPENFDTPFFSKSVSEFWRRWHITLGGWLKVYVLYPLLHSEIFRGYKRFCIKLFGKEWGNRIPTYTALFVSWTLIGLWHGGHWNYIFGVGIWFWIIIVCGEVTSPIWNWISIRLKFKRTCFSWKIFQCMRTFCLVMIGISFFRAKSLKMGIQMWWHAVHTLHLELLQWDDLGVQPSDVTIIMMGLFIVALVSKVRYDYGSFREVLARQNIGFRWMCYVVLLFLVIIFGCYGAGYDVSNFIYQGF